MKRITAAKAVLFMLALTLVQSLSAQNLTTTDVPRILSYQGHITNADQAVTGVHPITVRLYTDPEGKHKLWEDTYTTDVKDGIFSVLLGSQTALPTTERLDKPIWLGVSISGTDELRPLTQFTTAPYALNVPDKSITKEKLSEELQTLMTKPIGGQEKQTWDNANGGSGNTSNGTTDFLGGGVSNTISIPIFTTAGNKNTLAGGWSNNIDEHNAYGFIGGGNNNTLSYADTSSIVGGVNNAIIHSVKSTIGGGGGNYINNTENSVIGGGDTNKIENSSVTIYWATIAGGHGNSISATHSTISGGHYNVISDELGTIGGGWANNISAEVSTIGGGKDNAITSAYSTIGGGDHNTIAGDFAAISGGQDHVADGESSFIGGGDDNNITSTATNSTITGGTTNRIERPTSFIGGGSGNQIVGTGDGRNTIGGGTSSVITNVVDATIGGGNGNTINISANGGTIAGGWANTSSASVSNIGGGDHNTTLGVGSAIGGGSANTTMGEYSSIAGGQQNLSGRMCFAGGGFQNDAGTTFLVTDHSATLGGSELITSGQNQVVIGWRNLSVGNNHLLSNGPNNDRVFEIGSAKFLGNSWVRNNAFEVSYNGHSIVTQTNGSSMPGGGGQPTVFQGATYIESPVYAWGAIDQNGNPIGTSNHGISQVIPLWPLYTANQGTYLVTLSPEDPHGGPVPDITNASVTVTVLNNIVSDFHHAPPEPPLQTSLSVQEPPQLDEISDEDVQKLYGAPTQERETPEMRQMAQGSSAPIDPANQCGYATASQIGITILTTTYPRSFIVRTYSAQFNEIDCYQAKRAFFFKVTHR